MMVTFKAHYWRTKANPFFQGHTPPIGDAYFKEIKVHRNQWSDDEIIEFAKTDAKEGFHLYSMEKDDVEILKKESK